MRASMVLSAMTLVLAGQAAAQDAKPRLDELGFPLPTKAIARFGGNRLKHKGPVHGLAYSPDGKWLASAAADERVCVWDAKTGKLILQIAARHRGIGFVSGQDKGPTLLVAAGVDHTLRFWDVAAGKRLEKVIDCPAETTTLAVAPDRKLIAAASKTQDYIIVWNIDNAKEVCRWKAHAAGVNGLAFTADGKSIASSGNAPSSRLDRAAEPYGAAIWDARTGKAVHMLRAHHVRACLMALSSKGEVLATCGDDEVNGRSILLWDTVKGEMRRTLGEGFGDTRCLAISPRDKWVASAGNVGIALWDVDTGKKIGAIPGAESDKVSVLTFSPDGSTLATATEGGRVRLWDLDSRTSQLSVHGHDLGIEAIAISPDGKTIATTNHSEGTILWDRESSRPLRHLAAPNGSLFGGGLAFSSNGKMLAQAERWRIARYDVGSGNFVSDTKVLDKSRDVYRMAVSFDGRWVITEGFKAPLSLWDANTGVLTRALSRPPGTRGNSAAVSADGRLVASAAQDGLRVWAVDSGRELFFKRGENVGSMTFSPGGFLLAVTGRGVSVLDAADGSVLAGVKANFLVRGGGLAFSPDGRLLAIADMNDVKLWDVVGQRELPGFTGHDNIVTAVAFTPDSNALLSASGDATAILWDVRGVLPAFKPRDAKADWDDLALGNRLRAYEAYCRLRSTPDTTVKMLKVHLQPTLKVPAERMAELIRKLDSDVFAVRAQAFKELQNLGPAAETALMQARKEGRPLESLRRLDQLLCDLDGGTDWRRTLAGLAMLEEFNTNAAHDVLQTLSKGEQDSRLSRAAQETIRRLEMTNSKR